MRHCDDTIGDVCVAHTVAVAVAVSLLIGVYTTRAGQTSSYWAISLAWSLAEHRRVILVDCDMEGGTTADVLYLRTDDRSIANCFGDRSVRGTDLEAQAVPVPGRPGLRVVPGLRQSFGFEVSDCLRRVGPGFTGLDDDVVIADLGHPLAHPELRSPRASAEAICSIFHRTFAVIRDEPALVARSINVLRAAHPAHGEIIVCQQRSRAFQRSIGETIARELPDLPVRDVWHWDEKAAARMGDSGVPMQVAGLAEDLRL
jgi:MinD-like ATPase involved in chromosome partitioning or flagellar assembly